MDVSENASTMFNSEIDRLHRQLNQQNLIPAGGYRRNTHHYPVICYVNNIIGLYLSQNFDVIPIFIRRAFKHINELKKADMKIYEEGSLYYQMVLDYLSLMAHFVNSLEQVDPVCQRMIPDELLIPKG